MQWLRCSTFRINHTFPCRFRFAFPFGRPEGALKATLTLLERVLAKDATTPISREEIRHFVRKCLENAAYMNYTRVSDQAKIEGNLRFESEVFCSLIRLVKIWNWDQLIILVFVISTDKKREFFEWWFESNLSTLIRSKMLTWMKTIVDG